jgi:acid phosphatase family membrane protein YuiD
MIISLLHNVTVASASFGWLIAQLVKLIAGAIREKKFDTNFMTRLGGMPSSHATTSAACAMSIGLREGFDSSVFGVALGLVAWVMIDAQGVRRAAGAQARRLNQISEAIVLNQGKPAEKLVESLGHTRLEVVVGMMLGIAVAYLTHQVFPVQVTVR